MNANVLTAEFCKQYFFPLFAFLGEVQTPLARQEQTSHDDAGVAELGNRHAGSSEQVPSPERLIDKHVHSDPTIMPDEAPSIVDVTPTIKRRQK